MNTSYSQPPQFGWKQRLIAPASALAAGLMMACVAGGGSPVNSAETQPKKSSAQTGYEHCTAWADEFRKIHKASGRKDVIEWNCAMSPYLGGGHNNPNFLTFRIDPNE